MPSLKARLISLLPSDIGERVRVARDCALWRRSNASLWVRDYIDHAANHREQFADQDHLIACATWLARAQDCTGDGGVAGRYHLATGWSSSYPETTGYLIPTFLALASSLDLSEFECRAERAINFLLGVQLPSGAFPGLEIGENSTQPSIFNTAQIVNGLLAWYQARPDEKTGERTLIALNAACDWLVEQQDEDGAWRKFVYHDTTYSYMSHAGCWLAEAGHALGNSKYLSAAERHLDWVLSLQDPTTSWFERCGFTEEDHANRQAVTHTIAYTIWGVLQIAKYTNRADGIAAAQAAAEQVRRRLELSKKLPGELNSDWRAQSSYTCLTGNAQMALIWFDLHELQANLPFVNAALKAIDGVKQGQIMSSSNPAMDGGVPGSFPFWGNYITHALPNWSAKFFVDALLKKKQILSDLAATESFGSQIVTPEAYGLPLTAPTDPPTRTAMKIALLTRSTSTKVLEMFEAWQDQNFEITHVILESPAVQPIGKRVMERLHNQGFGGMLNALMKRVRKASPSISRPTASAVDLDKSASATSADDLAQHCNARGIRLLPVQSLNNVADLKRIQDLKLDLAVHAGGGILRKKFLQLPRLGTINAHMGMLPWYRGMNVAEWSLLEGQGTGATVHLIDSGIDTGNILLVAKLPKQKVSSIAQLRADVNALQLKVLGDVISYINQAGALPTVKTQQQAEGRQYFEMHPELRKNVEQRLARV